MGVATKKRYLGVMLGRQWALGIALAGLGVLANCGSDFRAGGTGGAAGAGLTAGVGATGAGGVAGSGGKGTGGSARGGSAGSGESGGPTTGGTSGSTGSGGSGGSIGVGGSAGNGMGGSTTTDAGTCSELSELTFQDPGFESGGTDAGWAGSGNYPEYASVTAAAARTGNYGAELNDTGTGVPGIEQRIPVTPELVGRNVSVTAWVRLVTFPSMRLLLEVNSSSGIHLGVELADTDPQSAEWQKLSVSATIAPTTDHLMIKIASAVADAAGVAYADDVTLCMDDACKPCAN